MANKADFFRSSDDQFEIQQMQWFRKDNSALHNHRHTANFFTAATTASLNLNSETIFVFDSKLSSKKKRKQLILVSSSSHASKQMASTQTKKYKINAIDIIYCRHNNVHFPDRRLSIDNRRRIASKTHFKAFFSFRLFDVDTFYAIIILNLFRITFCGLGKKQKTFEPQLSRQRF